MKPKLGKKLRTAIHNPKFTDSYNKKSEYIVYAYYFIADGR